MYHKLLIISILLCGKLLFSQKIEFKHSNPIIIGSIINITLEPIANNKKGKVRINIKKDGDEYDTRISREKFMVILNAIQKIKSDTIAVLGNTFDTSSSSITLYENNRKDKSYYAEGLNKKSQYNKQEDFWYATKLIIRVAKLRMENLIDYR